MVQNNTCWKGHHFILHEGNKNLCTFEGKIINSTGRKTLIQQLRKQFHLLEISELTEDGDVRSIEEYSQNPIETQHKMSHMMSKYSQSAQPQRILRLL